MSDEILRALGRDLIRDTDQFVNANLDNPDAAWPVRGPAPNLSPDNESKLPGLSGFAGGDLYLECEIHIGLTFAEWLAALQTGGEKFNQHWTPTRLGIGGFPAHAARTAHAKGRSVTLGVALPRKRPRLLQEFLDRHALRTDSTHTYGGPMPRTLRLVFADGTHRFLVDAGPETPAVALVAPQDCDVVLINPGAPARRRPLLSFLRRLAAQAPNTTIGIIARDDWEPQDWHLLQGSGCHVFLNRRELEGSLGVGPNTDPMHLLTRLRSLVSEYTVTTTLGAQGAMILNWTSHLTQVSAAGVTAKRLHGAGDTYSTTALLATALGHRFGHAALLAALDAARWVSGHAPTASLAELEEELRRRPEMTERHLPFPVEAA